MTPLFFVSLYLISIVNCYNLRIGLLIPHGNSSSFSSVAFATSAGAVGIAIDRIEQEQLLPDANISVIWRFSQCDETKAAGLAIEMFRKEEVDVMMGPPCSAPSTIVGVLAGYYKIPMISWAATSIELDDVERYQTMTRLIGSPISLGRAIKEVLEYFQWTRVALLYTDDKSSVKCLTIAKALFDQLSKTDIRVGYYQQTERERPTDDEMHLFLDSFPSITRVSIICTDTDADTRRFMVQAQNRKLAGKDFVYIFPELVRHNQTDIWYDGDKEIRSIMNNILFLEMYHGHDQDLQTFKKRVINRIKGWPFFYKTKAQRNGSVYSPFLHDAVYLYSLALNKTLELGKNITDARMIRNYSKKIKFQGVSGPVALDQDACRQPTFVLKGLSKDGHVTEFLTTDLSKKDGQTVSILVPEQVLWNSRDGFKPNWRPHCPGPDCAIEDSPSSVAIFVTVIGSFLVFFIGTVFGILYYRNRIFTKEMALMLWKVDAKQLQRIVDMQAAGSLATITTNLSDDIAEIVSKGIDRVAHYQGQLVWLKSHKVSVVLSTKEDHLRLKMLKEVNHDNVNKFVGLCLDGTKPLSIWLYCTKGSLQDALLTPTLKLDWYFKYSLIRDLVFGMEHLHSTGIKVHGALRSSNCLITNRWVLQVTDFGLNCIRDHTSDPLEKWLWTAPELLRIETQSLNGTQAGDVYSFSIVLSEILTRDLPFESYGKPPQEILTKVQDGMDPPFRPVIPVENQANIDPTVIPLLIDCWLEDPKLRPSFKHIKSAVKNMQVGRDGSLLDHALKMMQRYTTNLEQTIVDRTKLLTDETAKADVMLYKYLPRKVADRLKFGHSIEPESFDSVSVIFSDVSSFDKIIDQSSPYQILNLLNDLYYQFDEIIDQYEAFRVQTVNDGYMIVSGVNNQTEFVGPCSSLSLQSPHPGSSATTLNLQHHACVAADLALHFQLMLTTYRIAHLPDVKCQMRIGIHTGPAIAGVIGSATPRYLVFGETVNISRNMHENAKAGTIHISEACDAYLTDVCGGYITKPRGEIQISGGGQIFTFWLLGKKSRHIDDKTSSTSGEDKSKDAKKIRDSKEITSLDK